MDELPEPSKAQMIAGLIARGISAERAEQEYREIERELAYLRRPEVRRQLRHYYDAFAQPFAELSHRPAMPRDLALEVYEASDGLCDYCGIKLNFEPNHPHQFTVDHVEPVSLGGSFFDRDNLVACCRQCNSRKHTLDVATFRERGRHV